MCRVHLAAGASSLCRTTHGMCIFFLFENVLVVVCGESLRVGFSLGSKFEEKGVFARDYFCPMFVLGLLFDARDVINVEWCIQGYVRCKGCRGVVGFYFNAGVIDLFRFAMVRQVNVFLGHRSVCSDVGCLDSRCVQFLLRAGVSQYNVRYGRGTMQAPALSFNSYPVRLLSRAEFRAEYCGNGMVL